MTERNGGRERADAARGEHGAGERTDSPTTGPVGTMVGAAFGPFGAAVGSVVDANRLAVAFRFGADAARSTGGDDGLEDAATIEIEDTDTIEIEDDDGDGATANGDGHERDA